MYLPTGIVGIRAMGEIASLLGDDAASTNYTTIAPTTFNASNLSLIRATGPISLDSTHPGVYHATFTARNSSE